MAVADTMYEEAPISREVKFHGYTLTLFSSEDDSKILDFSRNQPAGENRYTTIADDGTVHRYEQEFLLQATHANGRAVGFIGFKGQLKDSYMAVFKARYETMRNPVGDGRAPEQAMLSQFEMIESPTWSGLIVIARDGHGCDEVSNKEMFALCLNLMHSNWKA